MRYQILKYDNRKYIKFMGMFYYNETDVSYVEYSHDELLLKDFLKMTEDQLFDFLAEGKQWINHMSEGEAKYEMETFFGDTPGELLRLSDVTIKTPVGYYRESDEIYC